MGYSWQERLLYGACSFGNKSADLYLANRYEYIIR